MPAWKGELPMNDRWAVIAYAHTLSGHKGPHVASEHPELRSQSPKFVTGDGTVVALRPEKQQVVLEHGEIKGFMEPMTMGYKVNPDSLLKRVKPGDKVRFIDRYRGARDHQDRPSEGLRCTHGLDEAASTSDPRGRRCANTGGLCELSN